MDIDIQKGSILTNQELMETFKVSNSGGMRRSLKTNSLVLIHHLRNSPYSDRWVDDELLYTGMGLKGDQDIDFAQNKTLANSKTNGIEIFLFENAKINNYEYKGRVQLIREPYYEKQRDENGLERNVIIFPLKIIN